MFDTVILLFAGTALGLLGVAAWANLLSFRAQRSRDYAETEPAFDLREVLNGTLVGEGMIFDFRGRMTSRFTASMQADWLGAVGRMSEEFNWSTGRIQQRLWHLRQGNDGTFVASADDVLGVATIEPSGAAVRMRYRIRLPKEAGGHVLDVTDWLYRVENGAILNRSEFRKFGLKVAEMFATFRPAAL